MARILGLLLPLGWLPFLFICPGPGYANTILTATRFATGLSKPVFLTAAPGDMDRLYVLEQQRGRIMTVDRISGQVSPTPLLQISDLSRGNEQGLLGLAFDPGFSDNRLFYVNYTDRSGTTNVVRYQIGDNPNVADPNSATTILTIPQPQSNHNAGWMDFGPHDNYLYIATGDGGGGDDNGAGHTASTGNAQDVTNNLLGKLLRIDVTRDAFPGEANRNYAIPPDNPFVGKTGDDEIWAYGLRNPWRNSFDRLTGDLYIADVGQGAREEINFQPAASQGGENYGWRLREGNIQTPGNVGGAPPADYVAPIYDYAHNASATGGFSVTGGYVYRGPIAALQGHYFFADFVSSQVWSFRYDGQQLSDFEFRTSQLIPDQGTIGSISSFGEDHQGNLYIVSLDGDIFRLDGAAEDVELVAAGSEWRYLDDGSDQGTAWRNADFNDSTWKSGPAQLGYGEGDEATVVNFGGNTTNRFATTYFRHEFEVADAEDVDRLLLSALQDDGSAVYLNGVEIFRTSNLAPNAGFNDLANFNGAPAIGGRDEDVFLNSVIPGDRLVSGRNVLAVEVHQHSRNSNDLSFDLRLAAIMSTLPGDFNQNGLLDAADIDSLTMRSAAMTHPSDYDLNADSLVNRDDVVVWVKELFGSWIGDLNLDREFNSTDLIELLATGTYEADRASVWTTGDFNGDGRTTSHDLVEALADGGYELGPPTGAAAVPEPSTLVSLLGALGWLASRSAITLRRSTLRP